MQQITKSMYWYALEVLPPAAMESIKGGNKFLIGEPTDHNEQGQPRYAMYAELDGLYYTVGTKTIDEFNKIDLSKEEITEPSEEVAQELELVERYSQEAIDAYRALQIEDGLDNFEESYQGEWPSDEDFVQQLIEDTGDIPKDLPPYIHIDWEWTAKEIMMDYSEQDGHYFRNI